VRYSVTGGEKIIYHPLPPGTACRAGWETFGVHFDPPVKQVSPDAMRLYPVPGWIYRWVFISFRDV